jgi:hypothetical protein
MYKAGNATGIKWEENRNYTFNASESQNVYMSVFAKNGNKPSLFTAEIALRDRDKSSDSEDEDVDLDKDPLDKKPLSKKITWNERVILFISVVGILMWFLCKRCFHPKPNDPYGANCL